MTTPLSPRVLEALSAYLDGQLSSRQRAALKARIGADPAMRAALHKLAQTRALLRRAPQVQRPRSFMLTPQMLGKSAGPARAYPAMRLVSAVASLMFAVVVFGDILIGGALPRPMIGMEAMSAADVAEDAEMAPMAAEMDSAGVAAEPVAADDEAVAESPSEQGVETYQATSETQTFMSTPSVSGTVNPDGSDFTAPASQPTAPSKASTEAAYSRLSPTATVEATEKTTRVYLEPAQPPAPFPWVRVIEALLALVALCAGVTAFVLRRR